MTEKHTPWINLKGDSFHERCRLNAELIVRAVNAYDSDQQIIEALTRSLKETKDAAAAFFRVIAAANLAGVLELEFALSKIENGFGKRATAAIKLAESRKEP